MDAEAGEFQDWEVLKSDLGSESSDPVPNSNDFQEIDAQSEGMIQTDYFSMDPLQNRCSTGTISAVFDVNEVGSENSDNPSWIDPNSDTRYPRKDAGEFWSDSGSDRSDDRKFNEFEGVHEKLQVDFDGNEKIQVGVEGIEEIIGANEKSLEKTENPWSVQHGYELDSAKVGDLEVESHLGSEKNVNLEGLEEEKRETESIERLENEAAGVEIEERRKVEAEAEAEEEEQKKKTVVWWKVPIEFLRYCVFRASPVWTLSVAAAVMGFVILGRRLYRMKKKTRGLELKVTMDDKKISQFMSRAARLNEAFSVVKRVPVVRPSLPAVGVTPWPVMSLR